MGREKEIIRPLAVKPVFLIQLLGYRERELLIHELEAQFSSPSPEASCIGLLLYLVGSATWVRPPVTEVMAGMWVSSSPSSHPQVPPLTLAAAVQRVCE